MIVIRLDICQAFTVEKVCWNTFYPHLSWYYAQGHIWSTITPAPSIWHHLGRTKWEDTGANENVKETGASDFFSLPPKMVCNYAITTPALIALFWQGSKYRAFIFSGKSITNKSVTRLNFSAYKQVDHTWSTCFLSKFNLFQCHTW